MPDLANSTGAEVSAFFESQQANADHWGKIGFRRIPGTVILIRDLNHEGWTAESLMAEKYESSGAPNKTSVPPGILRDMDDFL